MHILTDFLSDCKRLDSCPLSCLVCRHLPVCSFRKQLNKTDDRDILKQNKSIAIIKLIIWDVMDKKQAIIIFHRLKQNTSVDLEIPLYITAYDLIVALNTAFGLGIDLSDERDCFLTSENPIALLRGDTTLAEYGIRNGTTILFNR